MNKKMVMGVIMVIIFLMAGFNTVTDINKTVQSNINFVSTSSLKNGKQISYNVSNTDIIKNIINSKFNYYKIDNYSILSCNNILKVNINNRYYEVKWLINVIVNNRIIKLNFDNYNIFSRNNSIIVHEYDKYANVYNILSFNKNIINSNTVIKSNINGTYNIEFIDGNNVKNYKIINLSDNYYSSSINGIKTSWHSEMNVFYNGIIKINKKSYQLILNFDNIKLNKSQIYIIDPVIKPMRLPVNPCETTLIFKLYDNPYTNISIYNLGNEVILYGSSVTYNTYYSVNADNWHEVSCTTTSGNACSKINARFQGWFDSCWRSDVCTKITFDSGIYHGYIDNEIWCYAANINQWELYNNKIVLNGKISADTNDCYSEYIWEV